MGMSRTCKISDVLENYQCWSPLADDLKDAPIESSSSLFHATLSTRFRKWLTRETCTEHIVVRDIHGIISDIGIDITMNLESPVSFVDLGSIRINFNTIDTLATVGT
ncbi:MAG: hypothetical protein JW384_04112 [Nitrosomonadaceae bacterium]|nr:hypothetical protein [Nitrosomonadaceae bacterium]